jgi:hypothetical protein
VRRHLPGGNATTFLDVLAPEVVKFLQSYSS